MLMLINKVSISIGDGVSVTGGLMACCYCTNFSCLGGDDGD